MLTNYSMFLQELKGGFRVIACEFPFTKNVQVQTGPSKPLEMSVTLNNLEEEILNSGFALQDPKIQYLFFFSCRKCLERFRVFSIIEPVKPRNNSIICSKIVRRVVEHVRTKCRPFPDVHRRKSRAKSLRRHEKRSTVHDRSQELSDQERRRKTLENC